MHDKMFFFTIWLVHDEDAPATITIICNLKFIVNLFQRQDVGDGLLMEPYLAIVFHKTLSVGREGAAISIDSYGGLNFPSLSNQSLITEEIDGGLVVKEDVVPQLDVGISAPGDVAEIIVF